MTSIAPDSENRKRESPDIPGAVALVWDAVLKLPEEPQLLLRVLLTKGYDFQHPKSGHLVAELAGRLGVTDRTVRNMIRAAVTHPALQRAALGALPDVEVSRGGIDETGQPARAWSSQWQPAKGDKPRRSRHDRTRGDWSWSKREARGYPTAWAAPGQPWTFAAYRVRELGPYRRAAASWPSYELTGAEPFWRGTGQRAAAPEEPRARWADAWATPSRDGGAGLPAHTLGPDRRVILGTARRWVGRIGLGYTYLLRERIPVMDTDARRALR